MQEYLHSFLNQQNFKQEGTSLKAIWLKKLNKKNLIQITRLTQETQQYSTFIYIQSFPINRIRGISSNLLYDT